MENDFSKDEGLVREFVTECEELLQGMDQDMIALEASPTDADLLNRIFRALHTIKGTSSFLNLDPVVRLSHRAEDVLNVLRRGEVPFSRRMMDALLATRDQLGLMLRDLRETGLKQYECDALIAELETVQRNEEAKPLRLGEILIANRVIEPDALQKVLAQQSSSGGPSRLGELLVNKGLASAAQVGDAILQQKQAAEHAASQTMRVDVRKLDELINLVGELVLERNRLSQLSRDLVSQRISVEDLASALMQCTARLSFVAEELQLTALKTRMVPIDSVFRKFPRMVRDVAHNLQKEAELVLEGQDTELDKNMVELIGDPLIHLLRNALDHGIEKPELRESLGKKRQGTIRLAARQEGDQIVIKVSDDGAGIDPERVARKALEKGLITSERVRGLNAREILEFIFLPGFTTAEKASDISGRGVGLDVVRSNLKKLKGNIELESQPGHGTSFLLKLPLTLAILPVLLVRVSHETYALPLHSVLETVRVEPKDIHQIEGQEVLCFRDQTFPLIRLTEIFSLSATNNAQTGARAVILAIAEQRVALLVDSIAGQESTVIKPLSAFLRHCPNFAGATVSGDGHVRLVLDPAGLFAGAGANTQSGVPA